MSYFTSSNVLPLMEDFYTIQGEGVFQGNAAYFIRLAGCDVGCVWCDVKESWDKELHPLVQNEEIVNRAAAFPARIAVITGGEPLMYDLSNLTAQLRAAGFRTHLETSGAYPLSGEWDWICVSPKRFKKPLPEVLGRADELKVVIFAQADFVWAENFLTFLKPEAQKLLQPEWSKSEKFLPKITEYVKNHPAWKISLQTHKYMNIP
jgi:organic radical activating enzyme